MNRYNGSVTLSGDAQYLSFDMWPGPVNISVIHWFSYAIKTLITSWISFLQIGHEAPAFFNLLAQWKQVTRWLVLPWIMFPSRGLFSHRLHGFKRFRQSSMFSITVLCFKRLGDCSPMLEMVSWLSELWAKSKNSTELQGSKSFGFSSFLYTSLGLTTGADTVLRQSGTSIPSLSFSSGIAVMSDVEREWVNLEQSEYQSFLKAQHRKQYLLLGELNFLHSVHCHSSYKDKCSQLILENMMLRKREGRSNSHYLTKPVRVQTFHTSELG